MQTNNDDLEIKAPIPPPAKSATPIMFVPFGPGAEAAIKAYVRNVNKALRTQIEQAVRQGHTDAGRGAIILVAGSNTLASLQPGEFVSRDQLASQPLAEIKELGRAIHTYHKDRSYIIIISAPLPSRANTAQYLWWVQTFRSVEKART